MDNSLLRLLPLEIREMIYEDCFEDDLFEVMKKPNSLALLQLCRELRPETEQFLTRHTKAILNGGNMDTSALTVLDADQQTALAQLVGAIPAHLNLKKFVFELQHDCRVICPGMYASYTSVIPPQFTANTRAFVAIVRPYEAVISVNFTFHKLSTYPLTNSLHHTSHGSVSTVCPHDDPMTIQALEQGVIKLSASDKTKSQNAADQAFARKRRHFEAHRTHKVCFVKVGIDKALDSLANAQDHINAMIQLL